MRYLSHVFGPAFLIFVLFSGSAEAQRAVQPPVETIIAGAAEQRDTYINEFKDLLSQETKTFEIFDKDGAPKKKRTVVSTFIVYQSPRNNSVGEFRNVISVDGRRVENADKRAQDFFEDISKVDRSYQEWARIEKEGSRYDETLSINGLTLFQAVVLAENIRPAFEFNLEGTGSIEGRPVYIISYRQTKESRYISTDPGRMVNDGKPELVYDIDLPEKAAARVSGRFWIDAETFQVRKEERRLTTQTAETQPVPAAETTLEYQNSPFPILTPKRLVFTQFRPTKTPRGSRKELSVTFSYENFTKPDVEVKSSEIKS